jgi:hypothetical protein
MFKMTRINRNGRENRQGFSIAEMQDYADQQTGGDDELNMDDVCGCWQSEELSPTLLFYKDHKQYKVALLEINEYGQVIPKIYNVENNMLLTNEGIAKISLDDDCILNVWGLGEYEKMNLQLYNSETE